MPVLNNPKHEKFAQELSKGRTEVQAYENAGFNRDAGNANKVARRLDVQAIVQEITTEVANLVIEVQAMDRVRVLTELAKIASAPVSPEMVKPSDKRAALMDYARIQGWVIERSEVGKPGDFESMNATELREYLNREMETLGIRISDSPAQRGNGEAGNKPH